MSTWRIQSFVNTGHFVQQTKGFGNDSNSREQKGGLAALAVAWWGCNPFAPRNPIVALGCSLLSSLALLNYRFWVLAFPTTTRRCSFCSEPLQLSKIKCKIWMCGLIGWVAGLALDTLRPCTDLLHKRQGVQKPKLPIKTRASPLTTGGDFVIFQPWFFYFWQTGGSRGGVPFSHSRPVSTLGASKPFPWRFFPLSVT